MQFDGFDWDDGNWPKCGKHGVDKAEIEAVMADADTMVFPDVRHSTAETREVAVGRSSPSGRAVAVFFTRRSVAGANLVRR